MTLIEKYLFRQLALPVLAATAALGGIALLSQAVDSLELIVERGQSAWVLLKLTALAVPQLLSMLAPVALFVGALIALNRLHTEHEIVVCFAGGMSRWRVMSPAIRLSVLVALASLLVNLWVAPWSERTAREELFRVRTDLAATMIREGEFTQAGERLTVYAQSLDQNGLIRNLFIHVGDETGSGATVYTAQQGRIVKRDGLPALLMQFGSSQEFSTDGVLNFLSFDQYVFDLTPFLSGDEYLHLKTSDRYLHELLFPNTAFAWERNNKDRMLAEAHNRIASPLYNIAFMGLALVGVIGGSFNRTGYGRRIATVAGSALFVRVVGFGVLSAAAGEPALNVLQYLTPLAVIFVAFRILFRQKVRRYVPLACDADSLPLKAA
jgi:lipopolysaccharide export system permease protein